MIWDEIKSDSDDIVPSFFPIFQNIRELDKKSVTVDFPYYNNVSLQSV